MLLNITTIIVLVLIVHSILDFSINPMSLALRIRFNILKNKNRTLIDDFISVVASGIFWVFITLEYIDVKAWYLIIIPIVLLGNIYLSIIAMVFMVVRYEINRNKTIKVRQIAIINSFLYSGLLGGLLWLTL